MTGGIGSGKTAATDAFIALGVTVVDADLVAREVVAVGSAVLDKIAEHFGKGVLLSNGSLDRRQLRDIIFSNETEKLWLNDLMHPAIRQELVNQLVEAKSAYVILSAPLLLENNLDYLVDRTLVIDVPEALQVERASVRDGTSQTQIQSIMASQIGRAHRLARAQDVLDNSGSLEALKDHVLALHTKYLTLAKNFRKECDKGV